MKRLLFIIPFLIPFVSSADIGYVSSTYCSSGISPRTCAVPASTGDNLAAVITVSASDASDMSGATVTFGGVSATYVIMGGPSGGGGTYRPTVFIVNGITSDAANVVVTQPSKSILTSVVVYSGVDTLEPVGNFSADNDVSHTLTLETSGSWIHSTLSGDGGTTQCSSGCTDRNTTAIYVGDSNGALDAGSRTVVHNSGGGTSFSGTVIEIVPEFHTTTSTSTTATSTNASLGYTFLIFNGALISGAVAVFLFFAFVFEILNYRIKLSQAR